MSATFTRAGLRHINGLDLGRYFARLIVHDGLVLFGDVDHCGEESGGQGMCYGLEKSLQDMLLLAVSKR